MAAVNGTTDSGNADFVMYNQQQNCQFSLNEDFNLLRLNYLICFSQDYFNVYYEKLNKRVYADIIKIVSPNATLINYFSLDLLYTPKTFIEYLDMHGYSLLVDKDHIPHYFKLDISVEIMPKF